MIKTTVSLVMLIAIGGCASLTYPLPKCDGYSRRPLNRAMWEWEGDSTLKRQPSDRRSWGSVVISTLIHAKGILQVTGNT